MKSLPSSFPTLAEKHVAKDAFVEYWASKYPKPVNESKYQDNIGKPLTAQRVLALFEWKNNGVISKLKRDSIQRNYIDDKPKAPRAGDRNELVNFVGLKAVLSGESFGFTATTHISIQSSINTSIEPCVIF